jgi:hypothetical protein
VRMKKDTLQKTEEQQLRWYGHLMRMEDYRIAIQVVEWNPQEKWRCGRPVNTWKDGIRDSKGETQNMKNVSIESYEGKKYVFGLRKTVYTQKNSCNNIKERVKKGIPDAFRNSWKIKYHICVLKNR